MPMPRTFALALIAVLALAAAPARAARPVVADLSSHLVSITTGFSGSRVLVFGATDDRPGDIVMVLRGPAETHVVRKKGRVAGIWANRAQARFEAIPAFYAVAATAPLDGVLPEAVRRRHRIGVDALELAPRDGDRGGAFRDALVRLKRKAGLYPEAETRITTLENRLFRTEVFLPPTVPVGSYTVEVFRVEDGTITGAEITPLYVSKIGFSAEVFDFSQNHSVLYALSAILMAVAAGGAATILFRR